MEFTERLHRICAQGLDHRALRVACLDAIRSTVAFDAYVWVLTDPVTCVGSSPVADVPSPAHLPTLIRLKYLTLHNRWTGLRPNVAVSDVRTTAGERTTSGLWRECLAGHGVTDVMSIALSDAHGCWGFVDLWRTSGTFTNVECARLDSIAAVVVEGVRRSLLASFTGGSRSPNLIEGPAVVLLSNDIAVVSQTTPADPYLRALLPTGVDRAPIPAAAYNVAAQLLAVEQGVDAHAPSARLPIGSGLWVTLRAARIAGATPGAASIAVTIEPTPPAERTELLCRVAGLTERESEVLRCSIDGSSTRQVAQRLGISDHTVQDHFTAIFAKTGAPSRRVLAARATTP